MFAKHKLWIVKFDHYLASYLYKNKKLALEGIGTFTLDSNVSVPNELEKEVYYPIDGLLFEYKPKQPTDEDLIKYLVEKLGKIQPLVRSDLESYLSNIKQFINLGKPYTIEGIGTLTKINNGNYEFTPGNFLPVKEELNPKRENEEHNYPNRSSNVNVGRIFVVGLIIIAALAALAGIGWGVTNLLSKYQQNEEPIIQQQGLIDTIVEPAPDTLPQIITNTTGIDSTPIIDSILTYKMVFETTRFKISAASRSEQLIQFGVPVKVDTILVRDSVRYRLYVPMKIRQSDSTKVKDSLSLLLGSPIKMLRARKQ